MDIKEEFFRKFARKNIPAKTAGEENEKYSPKIVMKSDIDANEVWEWIQKKIQFGIARELEIARITMNEAFEKFYKKIMEKKV